MPQYFFDLCFDDAPTHIGPVELGNNDEAREYAAGLLATVFQGPSEADNTGSVEIRDGDGKVVPPERSDKR